MIRAGIWPTARTLVVALQLPGPRPSRLNLCVDRSTEGRMQLAEYLARERYLEALVPEHLHRFDSIAEHLHFHGVHVWLVPGPVVDNIMSLLAVRDTATGAMAAALARLPTLTLLRPTLIPLPRPDPRQLPLALPHPS